MSKKQPWDFWVLSSLRDGKPAHLKGIYVGIEQLIRDGYIESQLLNAEFEGRERKYTHRVRSIMNSLLNRRMVEHRGKGRTGIYRITDLGRQRLEEIEP